MPLPAYATVFTASLSLYNGATLLGTVNGTSDANGDPFYLGAVDATGANITSAVYSLSSIGTAGSPPTTITYNYSVSNDLDPFFCGSLKTVSSFSTTSNKLSCPKTYLKLVPNGFPFTVSYDSRVSGTYPNIAITTNEVYGTIDTDPGDLSAMVLDSLDLKTAAITSASSVPEPATWLVMLAGCFGIGIAQRRARDRLGGAHTSAVA